MYRLVSILVMEEYNEEQWVALIKMLKPYVLNLATLLRPLIQRHNTRYRYAILVLFKWHVHCSCRQVCSELFAIRASNVSTMLYNTVHSINVVLHHKIYWPTSERLLLIQLKFKAFCGFSAIMGSMMAPTFLLLNQK